MHGGTIEAASAGPGTGTTFTVRLPVLARATDEHERFERPATSAESPPPLRLLVVDDNLDAAESLSALLELAGHSVSVAGDGFEALRAAADLRPDAIFLDIGMPGMSGYEVAQSLRRMPSGERP